MNIKRKFYDLICHELIAFLSFTFNYMDLKIYCF